MITKLEYRDGEEYGLMVFEPESEVEYLALIHWLNHATNCGLPSHMIILEKPSRIKKRGD
jgi:hypothetical protein